MNAANEAAVAAYLHRQIGFYDIPRVIERVCDGTVFAEKPTAEDILATNDEAYSKALELIV